MRRVLPLAVLAMILLSACGGTDRPEGVVERWLVSLNQGKAGEPEKYAPESLSQRILPHWESRDPGDLDVIEVGKAQFKLERDGGHVPPFARVPFRVKRASGTKLEGIAIVTKPQGDWEIALLRIGDRSLRVPSEGGEPIASASAATWIAALAISAALMLIVGLLMSLAPKPVALPTTKQ